MKVKLLTSMASAEKTANFGEVVDLPKSEAVRFVQRGLAETTTKKDQDAVDKITAAEVAEAKTDETDPAQEPVEADETDPAQEQDPVETDETDETDPAQEPVEAEK